MSTAPEIVRDRPHAIEQPKRSGDVKILVAAMALVATIGVIDYFSGYEISFAVFYLLPVTLITWTNGLRHGIVVSIVSAVTWLLVDFKGGHHYSSYFYPYWNAGVRLVFFLGFTYLIEQRKVVTETLQKMKEELEARVHDRTTQLLEANTRLQAELAERQRAQEALREANQTFLALVRSSPLGIILLDQKGTVKLWNPAAEHIFGWSEKEVQGGPLPFFSQGKDDYPALIERISRGGQLTAEELSRRKKDGAPIDISVFAGTIRDEQGDVRGIVTVIEDVTARKRREEELTRLSLAVDQAAGPIVITDPQGIIVYVNRAFEQVTGYSRAEAVGQNPRMLKSGKHDEDFYKSLWAKLERGETWTGVFVNRRKDGSLYDEESSIFPVHDAGGRVINYVAIKRDATHEHLLEAQLRQAQKIEAVGQLAGGIAHDFNNLLTIVSGYCQLLAERMEVESPLQGYVEEIKKAGDRAVSLTRQLLAFSRRQVLQPQPLDLNAVVSNMEKMLRRLIGEDIELKIMLLPDLSRVKADPGQIEQVILNLAINSRDAMPEGGELTVETANLELDASYTQRHAEIIPGRYVMLAVSDTGLGMDAATQARIFEPFFTTKEKGKGTGLGLATVYGIVKQSGGYIYVYSEPGKGATFKVYLPVLAPTERESVEARRALTRATEGVETILLVEDEVGVRSLAANILRKHGYKVLEAYEPEEATTLAAQYEGPIHLLVTDVVMPRMSGRRLAEHLAFSRSEMKVLYMSGYTDNAVVQHGVLQEGIQFLQKPFTTEALARKVREVLDASPPPGS